MNHYWINENSIKSEIKEINYKLFDYNFTFFTDNGVFSKNKIDFGSELLLKSYLNVNNEKKEILDVGCGYGTIGIIIGKITNSKVDMIDVNERSIHLTKMNIKKNKINGETFISDAYQKINNKYDIIITNPPIRTGNKKVLEILMGAKNHLNKKGELWFVIRKNQGALTIKEKLSKDYIIEIIQKEKGYYIFKAINT